MSQSAEVAVQRAPFHGDVGTHRQVMAGTSLAGKERNFSECGALRGRLRGPQAHLDEDEVCWDRIGNADSLPEGSEDGG